MGLGPGQGGTRRGGLARLARELGVVATSDAEVLVALEPDCIVYSAMADVRLKEAIDDLSGFLAAGINVVSSSPVFLQYPLGTVPDSVVATVQAAGEAGGASLFVSGIDPGFANDWLPLSLTAISERIDEVRCYEILNYATYDQAMVLFEVMGFGRPLDEVPLLLLPGVLTTAWGSVVRQLAAGLEVELDGIEEHHERLPAPERFEVDAGVIEEGSAAGLRFEVAGDARRAAGRRARARDAPSRRHRPGLAAACGTRLLPGSGLGRAELHRRPAAARCRRGPQHRGLERDGDAPRERHPCRGRRAAGPGHCLGPATCHRARARGVTTPPPARAQRNESR